MFCQSLSNRSSNRAGATAVELALILPFFCLFIAGTLEIGRFLWMKTVLEEAALAGCRTATIQNMNQGEVRSTVSSELTPLKVSNFDLTINPTNLNGVKHLEPVTVTVSVPYKSLCFFFDLTNGKSIAGSCVLAAERYDD